MERSDLKIDDITYAIRSDETGNAKGNAKYFIRAGFPFCYLTDDMTKRDINKVAKSMRQLGFTVIDETVKMRRR